MQHFPGTNHFLPSLKALLPASESPVFQPILLSLIAKGNLILRTSSDDVKPASILTSTILATAFGLECHRIRVSSNISSQEFVRSLFPTRPRERTTRKRSNGSTRALSPNHPDHVGGRFRSQTSYHDDEDDSSTTHPTSPSHVSNSRVRPERERGLSTHFYGPSPASPTSPTSLDYIPHLPSALVIHGIEMAGTSVQQTLSEILRTRRVVLDDQPGSRGSTWSLPDIFIVVYICSIGDGRERPPIIKGLLDRFSLSTGIQVRGPASPARSSSNLLRKVEPVLSAQDILQLQALCSRIYIDQTMKLFTSALLAATRHHVQLDGTMISLQCAKDFENFARAARVVYGNAQVSSIAPPLYDPATMDLAEHDIRRVYSHVVGHRLRVRDGPSDELMGCLAFGAVLPESTATSTLSKPAGRVLASQTSAQGLPKRTVREILKSILADV